MPPWNCASGTRAGGSDAAGTSARRPRPRSAPGRTRPASISSRNEKARVNGLRRPPWLFFCPLPAPIGTAAAPISTGKDRAAHGDGLPDLPGRPDEQGTAPRGRGECGFRSPKSFLGVNFFEGLPPSGPKNKGVGQKFQGSGHHGGGGTGMVHTILVEPTKWWLLTICKRLMICRCRQNIPTAILLRSTKSGGTILPGAVKWELFTEYLQMTP